MESFYTDLVMCSGCPTVIALESARDRIKELEETIEQLDFQVNNLKSEVDNLEEIIEAHSDF